MVAKWGPDQTSAKAATPAWQAGVGGRPVGFIQYAVTTTATTLSNSTTNAAIVNVASLIVASCGTTNMRWRDDGVTVATTTTGVVFPSGTTLTYSGNITALSFVAIGGTAELAVSFYA